MTTSTSTVLTTQRVKIPWVDSSVTANLVSPDGCVKPVSSFYIKRGVYVCAYVRTSMPLCVRACVRACARVCVCVCARERIVIHLKRKQMCSNCFYCMVSTENIKLGYTEKSTTIMLPILFISNDNLRRN